MANYFLITVLIALTISCNPGNPSGKIAETGFDTEYKPAAFAENASPFTIGNVPAPPPEGPFIEPLA